MGGEVLAVVRSGLYLDFRFLDMALSALTPAPDERCRVLATDGQMLYYQPARLLQLYQSVTRSILKPVVFAMWYSTVYSANLWLKGRREPQLWSLACDIAVENVIDSTEPCQCQAAPDLSCGRMRISRSPSEEKVVVGRPRRTGGLTRQTPGVLRQLVTGIRGR